MRKPDELIGSHDDPYMQRWFIFRAGFINRTMKRLGRWLIDNGTRMDRWTMRLPSVYLHRFLRSDSDRHFHDHVGWSISIVLRGGYWEVSPDASYAMIQAHPHLVPSYHKKWRWRGPGSITIRRAGDPHYIALGRVVTQDKRGIITGAQASKKAFHDIPIWSLWIRGPWRKQWGFYTREGWLPWYEYENRGPSEGYVEKGQ